jgi:hypothetical protein
MRIRALAGALALSGLVGVSLPPDAEAAERSSRSRGHDRGYSSRSYRAPRSSSGRRDRSYTNRSYDRSRYSPRRSYGYRPYRSYGYRPYRSYGYRPYRSYRYVPYAYDPYYAYAYDSYYYDDPYGYGDDPYGDDRYGYNGPYPRYRSGRAHYHGRLFCVRPHVSIRIGF